MALVLTNGVSTAISAHGRATYPNECCGALIGRDGLVIEAFPLPNTTSWPSSTGRPSLPARPVPASTYASALKSDRHGIASRAEGARVTWATVIGVCVDPGP